MAKRQQTGYVISAHVAFVPHPDKRGLWVRTHPCVLRTECPAPPEGCGAGMGEPCRRSRIGRVSSLGRYRAVTCPKRRAAVRELPLDIPPFASVFVR